MDLSRFPRLNLFPRPTPLEEMVNLRRAIGCKPRLFVKRDDTTAVALGGNKTRKLDFVMADAAAQGADVIITAGGVQSNHCRQTLAVARRLGMECHLILTGAEPAQRQGNLLIYAILGAEMHFIGLDGNVDAALAALAEELRAAGRKPYLIPIGASVPLGALGYAESVCEVAEQARALGVQFGHGFLATGSAGTQAGAEIGARECCPAMRIHGVSVSRGAAVQREKVAALANETYAFLGISKHVTADEIIVHDQYYGERYAVPTPEGVAAIRLLGRTEGLLTDPTYTGKGLAGMLDLLRKGACDDAEAVLFFHTGGAPGLFAVPELFI